MARYDENQSTTKSKGIEDKETIQEEYQNHLYLDEFRAKGIKTHLFVDIHKIK